MFTTKEAVTSRLGVEVDSTTLSIAHSMIEAYVGRVEADIDDATDQDILGRATQFQAAYINTLGESLLEQVALKQTNVGETTTVFDTSVVAPFMSVWAVMVCKKLSWMSTRTVHTGPVFDSPHGPRGWLYE